MIKPVLQDRSAPESAVRDILWRTNLEHVREHARQVRRPIVVKPLNQGGSGEFW
jgi:hypothetical protein